MHSKGKKKTRPYPIKHGTMTILKSNEVDVPDVKILT
jgi:hypothetical protein